MRGNLVGRKRFVEVALLFDALLFFFRSAKILPGTHEIIRCDAKSALNEKIQRGLRNGTEVQQTSVFHVTQKPEKILQTVRGADVLRTMAGRGSDCGRH